jgi:transcriptional regulator with XRE-family HTH domain
MIGYTMYMQQTNKSANAKNLGVKFGRHCIKNNISAAKLAEKFGVSRQTIYNWFSGRHEPGPQHIPQINKILGL